MKNRRLPRFIVIALMLPMILAAREVERKSLALAQVILNPAPSTVSPSSGAPVTTLSPLAPAAAAPAAAASPAAAAPGAPAALSTTSALPVLNPAPMVIGAQPTPVPQTIFRCSCFGVGLGAQWIGQVSSSSFTMASQAAKGQCSSYMANTNVGSPYIVPPGAPTIGRSVYPGVNPNFAPGNVATYRSASPLTQLPASQIAAANSGYCSRCACN
ncbi:MAG TPA: hypothetical protein VN867_03270 [Candidatus Binataceae bacterium]|nr:hypothetical protein [Candidatus Binataceae bacterium]